MRKPVAYLFSNPGAGLRVVYLTGEFRAWMAPASAWRVRPLYLSVRWRISQRTNKSCNIRLR
jgi:hypothetical protein